MSHAPTNQVFGSHIFASARDTLRRIGPLTLWLLAVAAILFLAFAKLVDDARERDDIGAFDLRVAPWFESIRTPVPTRAAEVLGAVTAPALFGVAMLVVAALLRWRTKSWRAGAYLVVTAFGAGALTYTAKHFINVARPVPPESVAFDAEPGMPSGHVLMAAAMSVIVVYLLWSRARTTSARVALAASGVLFVAIMAVSRLYLGAHWLSDVVAGAALGTAWALLVIAVSRSGAFKSLVHRPTRHPASSE